MADPARTIEVQASVDELRGDSSEAPVTGRRAARQPRASAERLRGVCERAAHAASYRLPGVL